MVSSQKEDASASMDSGLQPSADAAAPAVACCSTKPQSTAAVLRSKSQLIVTATKQRRHREMTHCSIPPPLVQRYLKPVLQLKPRLGDRCKSVPGGFQLHGFRGVLHHGGRLPQGAPLEGARRSGQGGAARATRSHVRKLGCRVVHAPPALDDSRGRGACTRCLHSDPKPLVLRQTTADHAVWRRHQGHWARR